MSQVKKFEKMDENSNYNNIQIPQKSQNDLNKKRRHEPGLSKTAPIEEFSKIEGAEADDYISTCKYYKYYHSIKPVDPRLPKPTYTPQNGQNSVREASLKNEEEEHKSPKENPFDTHIKSYNSTQNQTNLERDISNNPIKDNSSSNLAKAGAKKEKNISKNENNGNIPSSSFQNYYINQNNIHQYFLGINPFYPFNYLMINNGEMGQNYYYKAPRLPSLPQMPLFPQYNLIQSEHKSSNLPLYNNLTPYNQAPQIFGGGSVPQKQDAYRQYSPAPKKEKKKDIISLKDIIQDPVFNAKSDNGSSRIQIYYEIGSEEVKNKILEKLKPEIFNLSKHRYGNYVIQQIFGVKDQEKHLILMEAIKGNIIELSLDEYGSRVIQRLIEVIDDKNLKLIFSEIQDKISEFIKDKNGNHVIQKLIERLKEEEFNKIFDVINENLIKFAKEQYGCYIIQSLLKKCNKQLRDKILKKIFENSNELINNDYGNYIFSFILENNMITNNEFYILENIKKNIFEWGRNKYAVHVIEKVLDSGSQEQKRSIIEEIISLDDKNKNTLLILAKDKYGNFLVQKLLETCDGKNRKIIIDKIISNKKIFENDPYAKYVLKKIKELKN